MTRTCRVTVCQPQNQLPSQLESKSSSVPRRLHVCPHLISMAGPHLPCVNIRLPPRDALRTTLSQTDRDFHSQLFADLRRTCDESRSRKAATQLRASRSYLTVNMLDTTTSGSHLLKLKNLQSRCTCAGSLLKSLEESSAPSRTSCSAVSALRPVFALRAYFVTLRLYGNARFRLQIPDQCPGGLNATSRNKRFIA